MEVPSMTTDISVGRDIDVLAKFIQIYCRDLHTEKNRERFLARGRLALYFRHHNLHLCEDCSRLLLHGAAKRMMCSLDPKPRCKKCPMPCYRPGYRESIREVMRYAGRKMILTGRVDLLYKFLL